MTLPAGAWDYISDGLAPTADRVRRALGEDEVLLGKQGAAAGRDALTAQVLGLGPLQHLVLDPTVTDILVNGAGEVWVDRGDGLAQVPGGPPDEASVRALAVRLAALAGRRLDDAAPFVDGLLPGGVRLHAILPPLADRVLVSLRVPRRTAPRLADLSAAGSMSARVTALLRRLVLATRSFLVSGGTGSGKTTLLSALLAEVSHQQRIVIVEDVAELVVAHPHVVCVQTRSPNVEGYGGVDLVSLVRQSLRMRPDRLVVGEVRGAEVRELLTALNTGHHGGCGTVHANSAQDVVARFVALGALAGMSVDAVCAQLSTAVDVVLHLRRQAGLRRVCEVAVVVEPERGNRGLDGGRVAGPGRGGGAVMVLPALTDDGGGGELCAAEGWPSLRRLIDWPEEAW